MKSKIMMLIILLIFSGLLVQSCSSSRDDGAQSEDQKQQEELDEIEALLGISGNDSDKPKQKSGDEKLGLMDSQDLAGPASDSDAMIKKKDKEIQTLKKETNQKDLVISDLKAQISMQQSRIESMEKNQAETMTSRPMAYSSVSVGDVSPAEYKQKYDEGYSLFNSRQYDAAQQVFESLLASNANHSLADNAQYWIGEISYARRNYDKAIMDFEKVFTFPKSNKNDYAQFKLGLCYLKKGDAQKAREEFQRLIDLYPKSELVSRTQQHLQNL